MIKVRVKRSGVDVVDSARLSGATEEDLAVSPRDGGGVEPFVAGASVVASLGRVRTDAVVEARASYTWARRYALVTPALCSSANGTRPWLRDEQWKAGGRHHRRDRAEQGQPRELEADADEKDSRFVSASRFRGPVGGDDRNGSLRIGWRRWFTGRTASACQSGRSLAPSRSASAAVQRGRNGTTFVTVADLRFDGRSG